MTTALPIRPAVNLEDAIRPFAGSAPKPDRGLYFIAADGRTSGEVTNTEGEDIPALVFTARCKVECTTMGAQGFTAAPPGGDDTEQEEEQREVHVERIENPDDPTQYVDVEVVDRIAFRNKSKLLRTFNLNNG